jgi:SAM-dependent methyltransferase
VILALPLTALSIIKWRSEEFQRAMGRHFSYFDRPAHYVRATLLFQRPFWREHLNSAWWMMDAFDGCCVYDEGARLDLGQWGALGFLIAGNAALELANLPDERIERLCLDALPPALAHGRELIVDRRIHRWMASVNAIPGGHPVRSRYQNHRPDPEQLPGVYIVGDYMFDATINGALDSADAATDMLLADILERRQSLRRGRQTAVATQAGVPASFAVALELLFASANIPDLMRAAWSVGPKARVLLLGSASGKHVDELRELGYDAHGFEWREPAYADTPLAFQSFNTLGGLPRLPFPDGHFDIVVDAGLCCLPRSDAPTVLRELRRITKSGLLFGSRTTDLPIDLIDRHSLLEGVQTLASRWDWSEMLFGAGFVHTLMDPERMHGAWTSVQASGAGAGRWYEDAESLLYCVYSVAPLDWEEMRKDEMLRAVDERDDLRVTVDGTK